MTKVSVDEAKERLPELLDEVAQGEDVQITSGDGSITFRLVVVARETAHRAKRVADLHPDFFTMSDDFMDESPEINAMFYGE
ncbi:MAG: type II toxin-antitoxin system prevent-host-death family antitoxin [Bacteroidetes bacterium]|nr:type II toxin-antitoxin system prevent-host-death family antitoxin [Bacteroidota bacterium]